MATVIYARLDKSQRLVKCGHPCGFNLGIVARNDVSKNRTLWLPSGWVRDGEGGWRLSRHAARSGDAAPSDRERPGRHHHNARPDDVDGWLVYGLPVPIVCPRCSRVSVLDAGVLGVWASDRLPSVPCAHAACHRLADGIFTYCEEHRREVGTRVRSHLGASPDFIAADDVEEMALLRQLRPAPGQQDTLRRRRKREASR